MQRCSELQLQPSVQSRRARAGLNGILPEKPKLFYCHFFFQFFSQYKITWPLISVIIVSEKPLVMCGFSREQHKRKALQNHSFIHYSVISAVQLSADAHPSAF